MGCLINCSYEKRESERPWMRRQVGSDSVVAGSDSAIEKMHELLFYERIWLVVHWIPM